MKKQEFSTIDFYPGAYGPTIRLDLQSYDMLRLLYETLLRLVKGSVAVVELLSLNEIRQGEIDSFRVALANHTNVSFDSIKKEEGHPKFLWEMALQDLETTLGIIEGFLERNRCGHYYLYEDAIIIELAYKE